MNKKFYVRYETPDGDNWASVMARLNMTNSEFIINSDPAKTRDYDQSISAYFHRDYRMQIFKTISENPLSFLSIGSPSGITDQTVSISAIDFGVIESALSTGKYPSVFFAFYDNGQGEFVSDLDTVTHSGYYGRNTASGKVENVQTGEVLDDSSVKLSLWYNVVKIGNNDIYYLIANPNLVTITQNIGGTFGGVDYIELFTYDGGLAVSVFKPLVVSGGKIIGTDNIAALGDTLTIDVTGDSILVRAHGNPSPNVDLVVDASVPYTVENNILTLDLTGKEAAYVEYKWKTNSDLDFALYSQEGELKRSFVIHKIEGL